MKGKVEILTSPESFLIKTVKRVDIPDRGRGGIGEISVGDLQSEEDFLVTESLLLNPLDHPGPEAGTNPMKISRGVPEVHLRGEVDLGDGGVLPRGSDVSQGAEINLGAGNEIEAGHWECLKNLMTGIPLGGGHFRLQNRLGPLVLEQKPQRGGSVTAAWGVI